MCIMSDTPMLKMTVQFHSYLWAILANNKDPGQAGQMTQFEYKKKGFDAFSPFYPFNQCQKQKGIMFKHTQEKS